MTIHDHQSDLDMSHIHRVASQAARTLADHGKTLVQLSPGDRTRYELAIVLFDQMWTGDDARPTATHGAVVSLVNFGSSFTWTGSYLTASYVADKLGSGSIATGTVVAAFLNVVSDILPSDLLGKRA